jgi:hypothetical protein
MPGISIDFAKVYIIFIKDEKEDYNLHFLAISTQPINHRKSQKTSIKFIPCLGMRRSQTGNEFTYRIALGISILKV